MKSRMVALRYRLTCVDPENGRYISVAVVAVRHYVTAGFVQTVESPEKRPLFWKTLENSGKVL